MSAPQDPASAAGTPPSASADADPPTAPASSADPGQVDSPTEQEPESDAPAEPADVDLVTESGADPAAERVEAEPSTATASGTDAESADADPPTEVVDEPEVALTAGSGEAVVGESPDTEPADADPPTLLASGEPLHADVDQSTEVAAGERPEPPAAAEDSGPEPETALGERPDAESADADPPTEVVDDETDELPELSEDDLDKALEALLLVVDSPVEEDVLAQALGVGLDRVVDALRRMADDLTERQRGFDLRRVGGGWRYYTRDKYAPYVEKMLLDGQRAKLTRAALETLAVIAYRQPVTRSRVAAVRGVNCDGVIRTLLARGLVEETGTDLETGGYLYRTTELFLERLGLSSLDDLPPIAPLLPEVDSIDDV